MLAKSARTLNHFSPLQGRVLSAKSLKIALKNWIGWFSVELFFVLLRSVSRYLQWLPWALWRPATGLGCDWSNSWPCCYATAFISGKVDTFDISEFKCLAVTGFRRHRAPLSSECWCAYFSLIMSVTESGKSIFPQSSSCYTSVLIDLKVRC